MKLTWPSNIIGRLEITWTSPRASACWYQTSMAFEQDSGPPGTCAHPFSQLNVGPQMSKPPCLGLNFINDWSDKFDSIRKGYVKQINDILMNFSTQFEKPCYVKHGFQLPSRRNFRAVEPPMKSRMVSQRGHELNSSHLLRSSLRPGQGQTQRIQPDKGNGFSRRAFQFWSVQMEARFELHIKVI